MQLIESFVAVSDALLLQVGDERDTAHIDTGPERNRAVTMLAHNVPVHILRIHIQMIRHEPSKP